jgi:flagellar motor protein MotB
LLPRGVLPQNTVDVRVGSHVIDALKDTRPEDANRVVDAIKQINDGKELEPLDKAEKQFIAESRNQFGKQPARAIDDNWKALTRALQNSRDLEKRLDIADSVMRSTPSLKKGAHDWPPIIKLKDTEGYTFARGSAEFSEKFLQKLYSDGVPQILAAEKDFDVDVIEVIGHTDETEIFQRYSNLDKQLLEVTKGTGAINTLLPADNAGLGLARAVSVARALAADSRLSKFRILPLSGGQLIDTNDTIAQGAGGDVKERRRIEIRLRRSQN